MIVPIDAYERVCTDNARLQKELEDEHALAEALGHELEQAKGENTRLRELVAELYEDQCIDGDRWKYADRMRELGIEVEE